MDGRCILEVLCSTRFYIKKNNERIFFVSKGIDYKFDILINDTCVHKQEGMFTIVEIDLTDIAKQGDKLEIILYPIPKRAGAPKGRWQADQSCKPAVSYGWDWHPRLIPTGIWDETYIELRSKIYIENIEYSYELVNDLSQAIVKYKVDFSEDNVYLIFVMTDLSTEKAKIEKFQLCKRKFEFIIEIDNVKLWWPHEYGEQCQYSWNLSIVNEYETIIDYREGKIGFRKVRLIMHEGAWEEPNDFPKSRSNPPITMEINNTPIFCKGSNWVNPEIFPGSITRERYEVLISLGKSANMNMFRVWGGGIINKESFYELCDQYGIMVWQEFPLACNNYEATPQYLSILEKEAASIIKRLKKFSSVVLWCGGNELFNAWSGMTDQSLALRLLNAKCYEIDPNTPFIMTSPLSGMAHGYYLFDYSDGQDVLSKMIKATNTAYTEFGCPGPSSLDYIRTFIPENELNEPKYGSSWEHHHAIGAWPGGGEDTWFTINIIKKYFNMCYTIEELIEKGQLLQCVGYKSIFEEARRQKPRCSMALNWCFNEPWPTAANNSIINYPAIPKSAYFAVKSACRPTLVSARIPKFSWQCGETLSIELWILNDSLINIEAGNINCYIVIDKYELKLLTWEHQSVEAMKNLLGPTIHYKLEEYSVDKLIEIKLESESMQNFNSTYDLLIMCTNNMCDIKRNLNF